MFRYTEDSGANFVKQQQAVLVLSTHTSLWCEHVVVRLVLNMKLEETKTKQNQWLQCLQMSATKEN